MGIPFYFFIIFTLIFTILQYSLLSPKPVQHQLRAQAGEGSGDAAGGHEEGEVEDHAFSGY